MTTSCLIDEVRALDETLRQVAERDGDLSDATQINYRLRQEHLAWLDFVAKRLHLGSRAAATRYLVQHALDDLALHVYSEHYAHAHENEAGTSWNIEHRDAE